jgi:predicted small metal-binding protein
MHTRPDTLGASRAFQKRRYLLGGSPNSFEGDNMAKVLKCGDVNPGCNAEIRADSEHEVLRKAAEHAKTAHHMERIPAEVLSKVKSAIHDEGEARTQKAGSS